MALRYKVKDVADDGNCFFNSLLGAAKDSGALARLTTCFLQEPVQIYESDGSLFVHDMRAKFADYIEREQDAGLVERTYDTLRSLDKDTYALFMEAQPEWMSKRRPRTLASFRRALIKNIKLDQTWVGQIEVEIFQAILKACNAGIELHIHNTKKPVGGINHDHLNLYNDNETHYQYFAKVKAAATATATEAVTAPAPHETMRVTRSRARALATKSVARTVSPKAPPPSKASSPHASSPHKDL